MTSPPSPIALIAEDEPLLAAALQDELARAWPALQLHCVGDGISALTQALLLQPDVLFFDIRMPGMSGLEAAAALAEDWDAPAKAFPALVFVTAYDQYAVQAFEAQAIDYLLKPVQTARLQKTVSKLQSALGSRALTATKYEATETPAADQTLQQLCQLLASTRPGSTLVTTPLKLLQASVGNTIHLVPIETVVYFEAADKYVRVLTDEREYLIRTPLKELIGQLDPSVFWQIHRGTLVNSRCIGSVSRDEAGKTQLSLRGRAERLIVSRLYAGLLKAM